MLGGCDVARRALAFVVSDQRAAMCWVRPPTCGWFATASVGLTRCRLLCLCVAADTPEALGGWPCAVLHGGNSKRAHLPGTVWTLAHRQQQHAMQITRCWCCVLHSVYGLGLRFTCSKVHELYVCPKLLFSSRANVHAVSCSHAMSSAAGLDCAPYASLACMHHLRAYFARAHAKS
jgi:hypothetical protein